jgi:NAD(P)-dependent dehydrogenase (short-subunit alcohol dehydrogenase family)
MERIEGRTAFVTGAASGIGLAITEALVEAGARVAMIDWHGADLERESARLGSATLTQRLDVTDRAGWAVAKERVEAEFGPVEILVNNAGIAPTSGPLADMEPESFDRMIAIKLGGTFNGIHAFAADLRERGEGHIVNTASMAGIMAIPGLGAYTASKFGVVGLSEVLRGEMQQHGVGVSVLCPGMVRTNLATNHPDRPDDAEPVPMPGGLDPSIVGPQVVDAIRADELYIITHGELRPMVAERTERLLAAFDRAPRRDG